MNTGDFDTVLDLCRNEQRRILLAVLAAEQRSLTLNDLTKAILKYNHRTPITEVSAETLTEVKLSLHHRHVPRLESAGVIDYDAERRHVEPTEAFDQLQPSLAAIIDADPTLDAPVEL